MGRSKQLLRLADKPVIRWCLDALLAAGITEIIVVLGPTGRALSSTIKDYPLKVVWNTDPESDMAGSIKKALPALGGKTSAVLVFPVDHPLVRASTISKIIDSHRRRPDKIIIPANNGRNGHPTVFPRPIIDELFILPTLRDIIRQSPHRVLLTGVDDEGVLLNMNTPDDLLKIRARIGKGQPQEDIEFGSKGSLLSAPK